MNRFKKAATPLVAMLLLLCTACGGGGGGGEGAPASDAPTRPGGGTGPVEVFSPVSISLRAPGAIRDITYEGLAPHMESIRIDYSGDPETLAGRTVYVMVEIPHALYLPPDPPYPIYGQQAVGLSIYGSPFHGLPAGLYEGTMRIFACLDPACQTQLANSPLALPYAVEFRPALEVTPSTLEISTSYGTALPARTLSVSIPPGAEYWYVTPSSVPAGASPSSELLRDWFRRTGPGNTVTFQAPADVLPGVYMMDFDFDTVAPDLRYPSIPVVLDKKVRVTYTVNATGAYALTPDSADVTFSLSELGIPFTVIPRHVSQQPGGTFSRRGIRTDAFPDAATGHPLLPRWLSYSDDPSSLAASYRLATCDAVDQTCLPPGVYQGALLLRHTASNGEHTDFEYPVRYTLTP